MVILNPPDPSSQWKSLPIHQLLFISHCHCTKTALCLTDWLRHKTKYTMDLLKVLVEHVPVRTVQDSEQQRKEHTRSPVNINRTSQTNLGCSWSLRLSGNSGRGWRGSCQKKGVLRALHTCRNGGIDILAASLLVSLPVLRKTPGRDIINSL